MDSLRSSSICSVLLILSSWTSGGSEPSPRQTLRWYLVRWKWLLPFLDAQAAVAMTAWARLTVGGKMKQHDRHLMIYFYHFLLPTDVGDASSPAQTTGDFTNAILRDMGWKSFIFNVSIRVENVQYPPPSVTFCRSKHTFFLKRKKYLSDQVIPKS